MRYANLYWWAPWQQNYLQCQSPKLKKRKNVDHKGLKGVDNGQEHIFSIICQSRLKIYLSARARYIAEFGEVCALCSHPTSADLQAIAHLFMNNSDIRNRFVCG